MDDKQIIDRLDRGQERFRVIDENMRGIREAVDRMARQQDAMAAKVDRALEDVEKTKDIVQAWNTAKSMGKFTKWLAGIVIAVGGAVSVAKGWWVK